MGNVRRTTDRAARANEPDDPARPLPGSRTARPAGAHDYVVVLKDQGGDGDVENAAPGRAEFYASGVARTRHFQHSLWTWLQDQGATDEVIAMGEPTVFPLVTLTTTPWVAELIAQFPGVESVFSDDDPPPAPAHAPRWKGFGRGSAP